MKPQATETDLTRTPEERQRLLEARARDGERRKIEDAVKRQNRDFRQLYPKGIARIRHLIAENKNAAFIYLYLAEHLDENIGALVVGQKTLCDELGISRTTLWRHCKFLEEQGALVRIQIEGSVYAYALDPSEIWANTDAAKERALFRTKTLTRIDQATRRKIRHVLNAQRGEPELPLDDDDA